MLRLRRNEAKGIFNLAWTAVCSFFELGLSFEAFLLEINENIEMRQGFKPRYLLTFELFKTSPPHNMFPSPSLFLRVRTRQIIDEWRVRVYYPSKIDFTFYGLLRAYCHEGTHLFAKLWSLKSGELFKAKEVCQQKEYPFKGRIRPLEPFNE